MVRNIEEWVLLDRISKLGKYNYWMKVKYEIIGGESLNGS
jgi:hypothetical protein